MPSLTTSYYYYYFYYYYYYYYYYCHYYYQVLSLTDPGEVETIHWKNIQVGRWVSWILTS